MIIFVLVMTFLVSRHGGYTFLWVTLDVNWQFRNKKRACCGLTCSTISPKKVVRFHGHWNFNPRGNFYFPTSDGFFLQGSDLVPTSFPFQKMVGESCTNLGNASFRDRNCRIAPTSVFVRRRNSAERWSALKMLKEKDLSRWKRWVCCYVKWFWLYFSYLLYRAQLNLLIWAQSPIWSAR